MSQLKSLEIMNENIDFGDAGHTAGLGGLSIIFCSHESDDFYHLLLSENEENFPIQRRDSFNKMGPCEVKIVATHL